MPQKIICRHHVFLPFSGYAVKADPQNLSAGGQLTPVEKFVVDKVVAGQVADLQEAFGPAPEMRRLRAAFLEALLTDALPGVKGHRSGIYILHAMMTDPLSLEFAEVPHAVFLVACRFEAPANFSGASLKKASTSNRSSLPVRLIVIA